MPTAVLLFAKYIGNYMWLKEGGDVFTVKRGHTNKKKYNLADYMRQGCAFLATFC